MRYMSKIRPIFNINLNNQSDWCIWHQQINWPVRLVALDSINSETGGAGGVTGGGDESIPASYYFSLHCTHKLLNYNIITVGFSLTMLITFTRMVIKWWCILCLLELHLTKRLILFNKSLSYAEKNSVSAINFAVPQLNDHIRSFKVIYFGVNERHMR